jgi:hypothetical protein
MAAVDRDQQCVDGASCRVDQPLDGAVRFKPGFKIGEAADSFIYPIVLIPRVYQARMRYGSFY